MAHFVYPAGTPLGTVAFGYVVPHTDWQTVIQQLFKAVNGDDGGTWAPGAFITIGGSGLNLTGVGHTLAASARLNVESAAEIRLKNGALLKADGSSGDIRLEVLTNVATLTIQSGAVQVVNSGGSIDVSGGLNVKSGGSIQMESGGSMTGLSGSTVTMASGSTTNLSGDTLVRGTMTIKASGGPGSFIAEATTGFDVYTAIARMKSGSTLTFQGGSNLVGAASSFAQWSAEWWFASGADVQWKSGSGLTGVSGSTSAWAGAWTFTGATTLGSSTNLLLDPARPWTRVADHFAALSYDTGVSSAFIEFCSVFDAPVFSLSSSISSTTMRTLIEFQPPPHDATAVSVEVKSRGQSASNVSTLPTYEVVRWKGGLTAAYQALSAVTADAHTGLAVNWTTTETMTISVIDHATIDRQYRYGLIITSPLDAGNVTMGVWVEAKMVGTVGKVTGQ